MGGRRPEVRRPARYSLLLGVASLVVGDIAKDLTSASTDELIKALGKHIAV